MKSRMLAPAMLALLVVAGCNEPASPDTLGNAIREAATPTGDGLLPAGIALDIRRDVRADRTYTNENGVERRRVTYEFVEGDIEAPLAAVDRSMAAAGFEGQPRQEQRNGNILVQYVNGGYGDLLVYAGPDGPAEPRRHVVADLRFPDSDLIEQQLKYSQERPHG